MQDVAGPGEPEFQLRSGDRGAAKSRPRAKKPISDQTGSLRPKHSRNRTAAPASRFKACPRVFCCGAGRTSNSRSISHCMIDGAPVEPLSVRLPRGPQPAADRRLGPLEAGGDAAVPGAAGPGDQSRAGRLGAVGPPRHQLGRQQDLGGRAVTAAGPPRGHGHGVGPDAAHGAGTAGPERAQHPLTPRTGHVPSQQGLLGPLAGSPRPSQRTSPFMTASIAYHTPLAAGVGWCCREPTLAGRRHELADEARVADGPTTTGRTRPADQCLPATSSR